MRPIAPRPISEAITHGPNRCPIMVTSESQGSEGTFSILSVMSTARPAVLLIAHGSSQPEANADLSRLADELRQSGRFAIVEPAYLELAQPDIDAGARN